MCKRGFIGASVMGQYQIKKMEEQNQLILGKWSWVALIPIISIPYVTDVSAASGMTLVALSTAGVALKRILGF